MLSANSLLDKCNPTGVSIPNGPTKITENMAGKDEDYCKSVVPRLDPGVEAANRKAKEEKIIQKRKAICAGHAAKIKAALKTTKIDFSYEYEQAAGLRTANRDPSWCAAILAGQTKAIDILTENPQFSKECAMDFKNMNDLLTIPRC